MPVKLHEQDLAKLVSVHFSDVLQQIADRDQNAEDADEDDEQALGRRRRGSAYASTLGGDAVREEKKRLLQEAQRLMDERDRMQKDLLRAVTHPATHHTPSASGAQEGEPQEQFPRAVRRTLLVLGVEQATADKLIRVEGEKGQKGEKGKGQKGKKGKGKW